MENLPRRAARSNKEVAELFAQGIAAKHDNLRSEWENGRLVAYSYKTRVAIRFEATADNSTIVYVTRNKYSTTTSKHCGMLAAQAAYRGCYVGSVPDLHAAVPLLM